MSWRLAARCSARDLIVGQERLEHHAAQTSCGGDEPGVVALEQLPVEAGLVVVALEVGRRGQLEEVPVPLVGLGEQREVVVQLLAALDVAAGVIDLAPSHRPVVA